jgi:hypothetical protein
MHAARLVSLILVAMGLVACGESRNDAPEGTSDDATTSPSTPAADPTPIPADRAGSFELDGMKYPFLVVRCDLTGRSPDGMLLRGNGTAPDRRRMTVEVERLPRGDMIHERATVYFGSIVDGDHWTTRRSQWPDGRWFVDPAGEEPAEGPLIRISGNELAVEDNFEHETEGTSRPGALGAVCPG